MSGYFQYGVPPGHQSQGVYSGIPGSTSSSSFEPGSTGPPGLGSFNPAPYSQSAIPGLTFMASTGGSGWGANQPWAGQPPAAINQEASVAPPAPKDATPLANAESSKDIVEEGELSEAVFEDLYEPYDEPVDARRAKLSPHNPPGEDEGEEEEEEYIPPEASKTFRLHTGATPTVRDRSGSYSPYLSPREVHNHSVDVRQVGSHSQGPPVTMDNNDFADNPTMPHPPDAAVEFHGVAEARKKAQSAILRLWPLNVRFQDYLNEGVDENIIRDLFGTLGLDAKTKAGQNDQPIPRDKTEHPAPAIAAPPRSQTMPAAGSSKSEERKDRIARLLAEKAAKPAQPTNLTPSSASAQSPRASAPTDSCKQTAPKPPLTEEQAKAKAEKELLLQQKLEALQRSRAARAQKASEKSSIQPGLSALDRNGHPATDATDTNSAAKPSAESSQNDSPIPGLFLSSNGPAAPSNTRKRPVAADFNDTAPVPYKRPFGHQRMESSLIIDVSDESEDEDVEMDMSSPQDGQSPDLVSLSQSRTASFRDYPPLSDRRGPRQYASPAPLPGTAPAGKPPSNPAKLDRLHQGINEMKRKIAEAERRKMAKKSAAQSPTALSSNGESGPEKPEQPELRRARSMGSLAGAGSGAASPVSMPDTQRKLPKPSQLRALGGGSGQDRRLRIVSDALPNLEASLTGKRAKLRLLKSEEARLQKEIEEMEFEKAGLEREAEGLAESRTEPTSSYGNGNGNGNGNGEQPAEASSFDAGAAASSAPESLAGEGEQQMTPKTRTEEHRAPAEEPLITNETAGSAAPSEKSHAAADTMAEPVRETRDMAVAAVAPAEVETNREVSTEDITMADVHDQLAETLAAEVEGGRDTAGASRGDVVAADSSNRVSGNMDEYELYGTPPDQNGLRPSEEEVTGLGLATPEDGSSLEPVTTDVQEATSTIPTQISNGVKDATDEGPDTDGEVEHSHQSVESGFRPYESVLKEFLSYRFHPSFAAEVAGGLRSLTYSNKVNPQVPMCPESVAGRDCPRAPHCPLQHMDSIALPDSEIILQLGDAQKLQGEEYQRYIHGLRSVLSQLKGAQSKDFDILSRAIIDYRAQFFGDKSKILPLGDVSL